MNWKKALLVMLIFILSVCTEQGYSFAQSNSMNQTPATSYFNDPNIPLTTDQDHSSETPSNSEEQPGEQPDQQPDESSSPDGSIDPKPADPSAGEEEDHTPPPVGEEPLDEEQAISPLAVVGETIMIYPGESYSFFNSAATSRTLTTDASLSKGITYDSVSYRSDGTSTSEYMDKTGNYAVLGGATAVLTATGVNPMTVTLKPEFSYSVSSEPALNKVTLSHGDSYRLVNKSSGYVNIISDSSSSEDKFYDYANYKETGELYTSDFKSVGKPNVPPGGELILTAVGSNTVTVGVPYRTFITEVSAEPAYTRVILNQGDSYQFTNISGKSDTIESDGTTQDKFDYVIYLPDGTESSRGTNTSTEPTVASGKYAVITQVTAKPVTFGVPYRTFDVERAGGVAISRITVYPGESVLFHNNGSLSNPIKNDANASTGGGVFDYAMYRADGSLYSNGFNSKSDPTISSMGYGVFTVAGTVPVVFDYTDDFSVEYTSDPAFHRVTLKKGESVTFYNVSEKKEYLDSDASTTYQRLFDYVVYYPDGTEKSRGKGTTVEPIVDSGNKVVVTGASDTPVTIGAIYTVFTVEDRPNEAISQITVSPGQSVIFHNGGSLYNPISNNARSVGGLYDYVMYYADGTVYSDSFNQSSSGPNVPKGGEAVVTVVGDQPIIFDYTDEFTVQNSSEPVYLRVTLNRGESYEFTNISSKAERVRSNASTSQVRLFNVVIFKKDGSEKVRYESTANDPLVYPGEKVVVTTATDNPVTFGAIYRSFRGQDDSGEHTIRTTLKPGESYAFINSSSNILNLDKIDGSNNMIDYAVYSKGGSLSSDGFGSLSVPRISSGSTAILTNVSNESIILEHSEVLRAELSAEPAFHRITLNKGMSYQFKNISGQSKAIESDASASDNRLFDYVMYKPDGTERSRVASTDVEPTVIAKDTVVVTTASTIPVTFGAVYRLFEASPAETPNGSEITLSQGQSYLFKNTGTIEAAVESDASLEKPTTFDVAVYGGANQPVLAEMDSESASIQIPPTGTAVVTVTSPESVTFKFSKPIEAQASTETALAKKTLEKGGNVSFHNKSYYPGEVMSNAALSDSTFYDYKVLDVNHNVLKQGEHAVGGQTVPATADIRLYNTSEGAITFAGPFRSFSIEEIGIEFIDLIDSAEQTIPVSKEKAIYYRFRPAFSGTYRFAVKETGTEDTTPQLALFNDKELQDKLKSSTEIEQVYGKEYTTLEWDLEASRYYYLKLDEKDGKALIGAIKAAKMNKKPKSEYEYGAADQLMKITLFTGDQIIFEYDKNGNLTKRTKNIFPYFK